MIYDLFDWWRVIYYSSDLECQSTNSKFSSLQNWILIIIKTTIPVKQGTIQILRNVQRGEGIDVFIIYRYVNLEGEGVIYEIVT